MSWETFTEIPGLSLLLECKTLFVESYHINLETMSMLAFLFLGFLTREQNETDFIPGDRRKVGLQPLQIKVGCRDSNMVTKITMPLPKGQSWAFTEAKTQKPNSVVLCLRRCNGGHWTASSIIHSVIPIYWYLVLALFHLKLTIHHPKNIEQYKLKAAFTFSSLSHPDLSKTLWRRAGLSDPF